MYENYEGDLIYKIIKNHFNQTGNLDPEGIRAKVLPEGIGISLTSVQSRIDEFKKTQAYKDSSQNDKNS
jgi:hypothetical protein